MTMTMTFTILTAASCLLFRSFYVLLKNHSWTRFSMLNMLFCCTIFVMHIGFVSFADIHLCHQLLTPFGYPISASVKTVAGRHAWYLSILNFLPTPSTLSPALSLVSLTKDMAHPVVNYTSESSWAMVRGLPADLSRSGLTGGCDFYRSRTSSRHLLKRR